jgi:hypothetical protein
MPDHQLTITFSKINPFNFALGSFIVSSMDGSQDMNPKDGEDTTFGFRIPVKLLEQFKEVAWRRRVNLSALGREAIEQCVQKNLSNSQQQ